MNKRDSDTIKILELISSQILPDEKEEVFDIDISKEDVEKKGLTFETAFLILKQLHNNGKIHLITYANDQLIGNYDKDDSDRRDFNEHTRFSYFALAAPYFIDDYLSDLKYGEQNKDLLKFKIGNGNIFEFNILTGSFTYNFIKVVLSPGSQEFKIIKSLLTAKEYQRDYASLVKLIYPHKDISKVSKADLSRVVRNIKRKLKILPKNERINPDFFKNIKNFGYKLNVEKLEE